MKIARTPAIVRLTAIFLPMRWHILVIVLFMGGFAVPNETAALNFVHSSSPGVGAGPFSVIAVEVNNDSKPDLISVNAYDNTLTVLTNNGNGTFTYAETLSVGNFPCSVTAADVNGDGKLDLISANEGSPGSLTVLTNKSGAMFTFSATLVLGHVPVSVVTADVNGDGALDLACVKYADNTLTVMTNSGTGAFGSNATYTVGNHPEAVTAVDINGDGKPDLISANHGLPNYYSGTLTILTNKGNGTFGYSATVSVGNGPFAVVTADVNGDEKPDLVSANYEGNSLTVLTNNGSGVFTASTNYFVPSAESVAAADVNGDGNMDLAASRYNEHALTVLTNDGSGIFSESDTLNVGSGPEAIIAADLNGDGKVDLVSANAHENTLTVLLNSPVMPSLNIRTTSTNVVLLSWSAAVPGFGLRQNSDLRTTNWVGVSNAISTVSGVNQVLVEPSREHAFHRLFHP